MFTHTLQFGFDRSGESLSGSQVHTADGEECRDISLDANETNQLVAVNIDVTQLKSIFILSDQNCTIKTNSTTGADTLNVVQNVPYVWGQGGDATCPLTVDVTGMYLSNGSADTASTVKMRFLIDTTVL